MFFGASSPEEELTCFPRHPTGGRVGEERTERFEEPGTKKQLCMVLQSSSRIGAYFCMYPGSCEISCACDQVHVLREEHESSDGRVKEALAGKEELATQLNKVMKVMFVERVHKNPKREIEMW